MPGDAQFRVDFLIGGAQKAGTTALAHFLGQHPEISLPTQKEAHFFDAPDFSDAAPPADVARRYRARFPATLPGRIVGDATPVYLYLPEVAARVHRHNPAMRWIILLRDPVERAVSHYRMERARGHEPLPFAEALAAEPARLRRDRDNRAWNSAVRLHSYADRGRYTRQLRHLRRWFGAESILLLTTGELRHQHESTLRRVYRFLGVRDQSFLPPPETVFATPPGEPISADAQTRLRQSYRWELLKLRWILGKKAFQNLRTG